jgi:hypothetical protein
MRDIVGGRQELRQDLAESELDEMSLLLIDLMENIVTIEDWTGETIEIPEQFTGQDANDIAFAAAAIRKRELPVTFSDAKLGVLPEGVDQLPAVDCHEGGPPLVTRSGCHRGASSKEARLQCCTLDWISADGRSTSACFPGRESSWLSWRCRLTATH